MSNTCGVCFESTDNKCPICENNYCQECSDNYDRAILETSDSSKYPGCINPKCVFLHTISVIQSDLKDLLVKRTLEIESTKLDHIRSKIEQQKEIEAISDKIEQDKQVLLGKLPKSLSILGEKFIKTDSRKAKAKKTILDTEIIFVKMCPLDYCDGMITSKFVCTKCDLKLCPECEELKDSKHTCDPEIVKDIKFILGESKSCPKCKIRITRSEGCDHMWCPNCKTHFSYNTGKIFNYGFSQPEELAYYREKYNYTLKPEITLSDHQKSFLIKGEKMFRKTPSRLDKIKYDLIKGNIDSSLYEKKICTLFEKDYINNLTRELYMKVKKELYSDSSTDSIEDFMEWQKYVEFCY